VAVDFVEDGGAAEARQKGAGWGAGGGVSQVDVEMAGKLAAGEGGFASAARALQQHRFGNARQTVEGDSSVTREHSFSLSENEIT
jgi:hypothetical protein